MRSRIQRTKSVMIAVALGLLPGIANSAAAKPLKVFILAGQSNMQGHANVSTMDSMADDPKAAPILEQMRQADGTPRVCDRVWISSVGCAGDGWSDVIEQKGKLTAGFGASPSEIGPEFTFGVYTAKLLGEPILLIKTAWGGRNLHTDFRPPSAGPETFNAYTLSQWKRRGLDANQESEKILKNGGVFYRHMIEHVRKVLADIPRVVPGYEPQQGYELAGFVWFQGFNDMIDDWTYHGRTNPGGYDLYSQLLADLIRDVRKDLNAPKLPFVIGVMGIGGTTEDAKPPMSIFRQAQAAPASLPEFKGNVVAVPTAPYWDDELEALRTRLESLWPKMDARAAKARKNNPKLTEAEVEAVKQQVVAENFTPAEQKRLKASSNGGYHYLGAAKILAPIGQAFAEAMANLQPTADLPVPTSQQAAWLDAGIGIFVHWAPNVYQGTEGDNLSTPPEKINPDRFDASKIVRAAKSANAGYLIFVAKHIGGYCAWQTETTDYSLKTSPWKNGRGDMVGDLARACREQGLRFGVYLSPRDDFHHVGTGGRAASAAQQQAYNDLYRRQLSEILTNYGSMFEMWFDGGNIVPLNDLIDRLAPGIITFQGRRANSTRWVGTEHGFAPYPCWNTIEWRLGETPKEGAGSPTGNLWCPAECDVSILRPNWFWSKGSDSRILSLNDLIEIYTLSVGRGVNLLLNVTPDTHGEVPAAQIKRLQEFGDEIRARFAKPLFTTKGDGNNLTLDLRGEKSIDHLLLREDIVGGERVRKFLVEGRRADGTWIALARGTQIGNRQIIPIPATALQSVRLTVQERTAPVRIRELSVYHVNRPVPKLAYRPDAGTPE